MYLSHRVIQRIPTNSFTLHDLIATSLYQISCRSSACAEVDHGNSTLGLDPHLCHMADTPSPSPPGLGDLETLVLQVFAQVWEEYNVADTGFCEATIGSLAVSSIVEDNTLATKSETTSVSTEVTSTLCLPKPRVPCVCGETEILTFTLPPSVEPYPEYESWTPTDRSIFRGDDSDDMQFLPFADEPAFDKKSYCSFFKTLAWQGSERLHTDRELPLL